MEDSKSEIVPEDPFDIEPVKDPSATAEEFLQKLDLVDDRWHSGLWIFRGQYNACWELEPSLFRKCDADTRANYEFRLIAAFISYTNRVNLPIPPNSLGYFAQTTDQSVSATQRSLGDKSGSGFGTQYDFSHVVFAIAQHSGVPTRLLDFTHDPMTAAYFAADWTDLLDSLELSPEHKSQYFSDILNKYIDSSDEAMQALNKYAQKVKTKLAELPEEMAVWAIRANDLQETTLRVLEHPYTEIRNLRSQKGIFLCETENYELQGESWRSFNGKLTKLAETGGIYKLTLPCKERKKLLDLLGRKRISSQYLKPSYETVAKTVRELTPK